MFLVFPSVLPSPCEANYAKTREKAETQMVTSASQSRARENAAAKTRFRAKERPARLMWPVRRKSGLSLETGNLIDAFKPQFFQFLHFETLMCLSVHAFHTLHSPVCSTQAQRRPPALGRVKTARNASAGVAQSDRTRLGGNAFARADAI